MFLELFSQSPLQGPALGSRQMGDERRGGFRSEEIDSRHGRGQKPGEAPENPEREVFRSEPGEIGEAHQSIDLSAELPLFVQDQGRGGQGVQEPLDPKKMRPGEGTTLLAGEEREQPPDFLAGDDRK